MNIKVQFFDFAALGSDVKTPVTISSVILPLAIKTALVGFVCLCNFNSVAHAQQLDRRSYIRANYVKNEVKVPARDGKLLHTVIYAPKDQTKDYPIMMIRSPYSCRPYGAEMAARIGPSETMEREGYIFVKQDVRGRWNSEGSYDNMRPHVPGDKAIDESSDTYDTVEWLIKNVAHNNGKVGQWGISYPGFYTAAALPEHHPALVAASPQAPISDFYFDDFHHNGAYLLSYFSATAVFGYQHDGPTTEQWYPMIQPSSQDAWQFYTMLGPLSNASKYYGEDNFFWQQLVEHPNYDEFWQSRSILPHLKNIKTNVMTVGGWYDAEDLYGPLNIYREIEKNNPDTFNCLVMGPWSHGDWASKTPNAVVGNLGFGQNVSEFYQTQVEAPFFRHFLKGEGKGPEFEGLVYDTGKRKWDAFKHWPPATAETKKMYLRSGGRLSWDPPAAAEVGSTKFVSDPNDPVPYRERQNITMRFTPRPYMTDDQRFASRRDDVLVFETEVLTEELTISGEILANLVVATDQSAADWVVKVIDVFPENQPWIAGSAPGTQLGGYQQMVRSEVIRGRFRNGFEKPEPFVPNEVAQVPLPIQDIHHTFKPGHKMMIHVQSTWFPLIDRNPQKYVDNIFKAKVEDFVRANHTVFHEPDNASNVEFKVLKK